MSSHQPRLPRKRYSIPALLVVLVLLGALVVFAAAPPNVDTFSASTVSLITATSVTPASDVYTEGVENEILGRQREAYAQVVSGLGVLTLEFKTNLAGDKVLSINTGDETGGRTTLTYDGTTNSTPLPSSVDFTGLGGKDLTQSGTTNGFRFRVPTDDTNGNLTVRVWTNSTTWSERTFVDFFPGNFAGGPPRILLVEFPTIQGGTCGIGGCANFANVGAVQFEISGVALDMSLDTIDVGVFDWGDLPQNVDGSCPANPQLGYATTQACEGPRHAVPTGTLRLGTQVDPLPVPAPAGVGEFNGQPTIGANGDNLANSNDEQGVTTLWAGGSCTEWWCNGPNGGKIRVQVNGTGYLLGWIDFDENGFEVDEVIANQAVTTGSYDISFNIPAGTLPTSGTKNLYARFRLFGDGELTGLSPFCSSSGCRPYLFDGRDGFGQLSPAQIALNQSKDGEVEDYLWTFNPLAVTLADFSAVQQGDAVLLTWETNSELNNRGFNLYRGTSDTAPDRQLNSTLIPSQSQGNPGGFVYTWEDRADLQAGTTYYYWVEDVDVNGVATRHGPVSVDFSVPTAVRVSAVTASPAANVAMPWAGALLALAVPLAGGLAAARRRRS